MQIYGVIGLVAVSLAVAAVSLNIVSYIFKKKHDSKKDLHKGEKQDA